MVSSKNTSLTAKGEVANTDALASRIAEVNCGVSTVRTPRVSSQALQRAQSKTVLGSLRLLTVLLVAAALLLAFSSVQGAGPVPEANRELREAWIMHRLKGQIDGAFERYQRLFESEAAVDIRARAAIGLGLIERDRGSLGKAEVWWGKVVVLEGVALRWQETASRLRELLREDPPQLLIAPKVDVEALEEEVRLLNEQVVGLKGKLQERGVDLSQREQVINGLRFELQARRHFEEEERLVQKKQHTVFAEELVREARDTERYRQFAVSEALRKAKNHLAQGRVGQALNQIKKVLKLSPTHREALELQASCRRHIALWRGQDGVRPSSTKRNSNEARLVEKVMEAWLDKARESYRRGDTPGALRAYRRVIDEFVASSSLISGDKIDALVSAAERGLVRCFEETSTGVEASRLRKEQRRLLALLERGMGDLVNQDREIADSEVNLEALNAESDPKRVMKIAFEIANRESFRALQAKSLGDFAEARAAFQYAITTLELFPDLDQRGEVRAQLREHLRKLDDEPAR